MRIVFAHNVYNRFNTLYNTVKIEKELFPDSYSIIGYNNQNPKETLKQFSNIEYIKFEGISHKIGCVNGCITTMQASIKYNPDVIIFSHDDVSLVNTENAKKVFYDNINLIINKKYDAICRKPLPTTLYGDNYYLMEVFFISKNGAEEVFGNLKLFNDENNIHRDIRNSISPEVFLYSVINDKKLNVLEKKYIHTDYNYNITLSELMGYTHKNAGNRGWVD